MIHDEKYDKAMYESILTRLQKIFEDPVNKDSIDLGVKQLVHTAGVLHVNTEMLDMLMKMLETLVTNQVIPAR